MSGLSKLHRKGQLMDFKVDYIHQAWSRRRFVRLSGSVAATGLVTAWPGLSLALPPSPKPGTYLNPVIAGDHPDAGAIRVGNDYYLVHTTDHYTPGLLIWHSTDLVHWQVAGAALDQYYGAVWAPFLCEYKGLYYIYYPCNGEIFVVTANAPLGPWSKPLSLELHGIDPAHGVTPEGRRVLYLAGGSMAELSADGLSVTEKPRKVVETWPIPENWQIECDCLEAPKLLFREGYYYLNVAEGGTAGPPTSHMVLSARSRNIDGPWEWSPHNPIVHTYSKAEKWWSKGHGRLVDASDGSWWMTLHAYQNGLQTLGRQILLLPIAWTADGWFEVPGGITGGEPISKALLNPAPSPEPTSGFPGKTLDPQWQFWKGYQPGRIHLENGALTLAAHGDSIPTTSVMTRAAMHRSYTVEVDVEIAAGCEAGLLLFYDSNHFCGLRVTSDPHPKDQSRTTMIWTTRAALRIVNDDQVVDFYYRVEGASSSGEWKHVRASLDVTTYQQNAFGGFLDVRPALYASGTGSAVFRNWNYIPKAID
jgi:xylan 1,4-beta-xylosidase